MNLMNQVILEGNVVRDSLVKATPRGSKFCVMPIAVNRYYKDSQGSFAKETGFYNVEAWGEKFSSFVVTNALKGRGVRVVGRLKQDRWKNEDGKSFSKIYVVAEHIDFKPDQKKNTEDSNANCSGQETDEELANLEEAAAGIREELETEFSDIEPTDDDVVF